jgi:hypothetical protein
MNEPEMLRSFSAPHQASGVRRGARWSVDLVGEPQGFVSRQQKPCDTPRVPNESAKGYHVNLPRGILRTWLDFVCQMRDRASQ